MALFRATQTIRKDISITTTQNKMQDRHRGSECVCMWWWGGERERVDPNK